MSLVYADNPKGYICRFRRSNLMEVPDAAEKFDSILVILASVLNAKVSYMFCVIYKFWLTKLMYSICKC